MICQDILWSNKVRCLKNDLRGQVLIVKALEAYLVQLLILYGD